MEENMQKILIKSKQKFGKMIPKLNLPEYVIKSIKKYFTVIKEEKEEYYFAEDDKNLYLPLYTDLNLIPSLNNYKFIEEKIPTKWNNELIVENTIKFDYKYDIQREALKHLHSNTDSVLSLGTGKGKTYCAIRYALEKGIRTVIVCHDITTMNQWKTSLIDFSELKEEDIGYVLGRKKLNKKLLSKKITIISSKTLSTLFENDFEFLKNFWKEFNIGLKIFDEIHLYLYSTFRIQISCPSEYNLYLTATLNRSLMQENDILKNVFPVDRILESKGLDIPPEVFVINYNSNPNPGNKYYIQDLSTKGKLDFIRYSSYIIKHHINTYFDMLEEIITRVKKPKTKIIIIMKKTMMLDLFFERFSSKYKIKKIYGPKKTRDYVGPKEYKTFDIVIGTEKLTTAALNIEALDVMINTFPFSASHNSEQVIGRIAREFNCEEYSKKKSKYILLNDIGFDKFNFYTEKHVEHLEKQKLEINYNSINTYFTQPIRNKPKK
jgi:superfamily II DNA or RNA helicase